MPGLFGDGPEIDAIFLSHAHGDHSGLLAHTSAEIPIWMSQGTSKMLLAGEVFSGQCKIPRPPAANGIRVYYNRHFVQSWQRRRLSKIYNRFFGDQIGLVEILSDAARHVMLFRPSMTELDFEGVLPPVHLLYSYWNGYLDTPEWQAVGNQVATSGGEFHECHTSGHIYQADITRFIQAISPRAVIPIHTTCTSGFQTVWDNVVTLEDGQLFEV